MKRSLDRAWVYNGRIYGPGEVEVPDKVASALEARGAFAGGDESQGSDLQKQADTMLAPVQGIRLESVTDEQRENLEAAGYASNADLLAASDADLQAIHGIGKGTVQRIRAELESQAQE